ncbi:MAG: ABC transporter permease [Verrucomicrobiae bacterium]|nr:ABC transporter permease [Verrucomicrobiae bacterium]
MTLAGFMARNALRNKRRSFLTIASVALSLFLLCTLRTGLREMTNPASMEESACRVAVRHKVSIANVLPAKQRDLIKRVAGVASVMPLTWYGGVYIDEKHFFSRFAVDPAEAFRQFGEMKISPEHRDAFIKKKTGCVVGIKTMERFHFKMGDRIELAGDVWPCDVALEIVGTYRGGIDETILFFNHKYLDEASGNRGVVGCWWVLADRVDSVPRIIAEINRMFRNSDAEVLAESERAFQMGFVSMLGNVTLLIGSISGVILFTMFLVTASTMAMAIRERFREIAILKAFGFRSSDLAGLIVAESLLLAMAGGVLGCGGAWLMFRLVPIDTMTNGFFPIFEVTPGIMAQGMGIAMALGFFSCLVPAWNALRLSVVDGLKILD